MMMMMMMTNDGKKQKKRNIRTSWRAFARETPGTP
jgi:hypothetical protein